MYFHGQGVEINSNAALKWWHKAAAQNFPQAQYNLGQMYTIGEGVKKDATVAYAWMVLAARNSEPNAKIWKLDLAQKLSPEEIAGAEALAEELGKKFLPRSN